MKYREHIGEHKYLVNFEKLFLDGRSEFVVISLLIYIYIFLWKITLQTNERFQIPLILNNLISIVELN